MNLGGRALWPCCWARIDVSASSVPNAVCRCRCNDIRRVVGHVLAGVAEVFIELETTQTVAAAGRHKTGACRHVHILQCCRILIAGLHRVPRFAAQPSARALSSVAKTHQHALYVRLFRFT